MVRARVRLRVRVRVRGRVRVKSGGAATSGSRTLAAIVDAGLRG
jgi:hypothetical protein